jgi:Arc/MetJ-type ribon-helix-helix transcriptional regulator
MKTLTVRLPEPFIADIEAESRGRKISKSDVVRERLRRMSDSRSGKPGGKRTLSDLLGRVARLSLMSYPQNADYIECRIEAIERNVPGRTLGDDKFTNVMVDAPPDEWMGFQDAHSASDGHERLHGSVG